MASPPSRLAARREHEGRAPTNARPSCWKPSISKCGASKSAQPSPPTPHAGPCSRIVVSTARVSGPNGLCCTDEFGAAVGRDRALELVESRATPSGVMIQVYRTNRAPDEVHGTLRGWRTTSSIAWRRTQRRGQRCVNGPLGSCGSGCGASAQTSHTALLSPPAISSSSIWGRTPAGVHRPRRACLSGPCMDTVRSTGVPGRFP